MEDNRGGSEDIRDLKKARNGVFFEICDMPLVIRETFEDILKGVEFERSEASFCEPQSLKG